MSEESSIKVNTKLTARKLQAIKTKESLYNAAIKLVNTKGYDHTTIDDIAKEAGTAVGTFYVHFKSKQEVIFYTLDRYNIFVLNAFEEAMQFSTFVERLKVFLMSDYDEINTLGKEVLRALYQESLHLNAPNVNEPTRPIYTCCAQIIEEAIEKGELSNNYPISYYLKQIITTVLGIDYYWCTFPQEMEFLPFVEERVDCLILSLLHTK